MGNLCLRPDPRAYDDALVAPSTSTVGTKVPLSNELKDPSVKQVASASGETKDKLFAEIERRENIIESLKAELLEAQKAAKAEAAKNQHFLTWLEEREERIRSFEAFEKDNPVDSDGIDSDAAREKERELGVLREQRIRAADEEGSIDIDAVDWDAKSEELQAGFGRWEQTMAEAEWKMV